MAGGFIFVPVELENIIGVELLRLEFLDMDAAGEESAPNIPRPLTFLKSDGGVGVWLRRLALFERAEGTVFMNRLKGSVAR